MTAKYLSYGFVFLFLINVAAAFFETPSNNIIVTNNLYNGSFNLSELNLDNLYLNGTQENTNNNGVITLFNGDNWYYSNEGTTTGAIQIQFPHNSINFSVIIDVAGYDSGTSNMWEGTIWGEFNSVNSWTTGLCDAKISGETPFSAIMFDYRYDKPVINIGYPWDTTTNPKVWIKSITIIKQPNLDWSGIEIALDNEFYFGGTDISSPNFRVWSNDNDGVGSGLDADYFGGNVYTKYIYGNNNWGTFTNYLVSKNYNDVDRTGIYVGCTSTHCTNAPFKPTGTTYSYVLNLHSGISNAYNKQLGFSISENKMAMRTEYGEGSWSSWTNIVSDDYTGNVNINGDITGNSFYTTNGAYEAVVYPDYIGIGTTDTTDYPNSMWFFNTDGTAEGYSIGEGRDDKLRLVSGYDSADGSFTRNDFVMDVNGNIEMGSNVKIGGNLNITGHIHNTLGHLYGISTINQSVAVANTWYNLTWNESLGDTEYFTFINNQTINVTHSGHYNIDFGVSFTDESPSPDSINGIRVIVNGVKMDFSQFQEPINIKQYSNKWVKGFVHAELEAGDLLSMQYISDTTDVKVATADTFGGIIMNAFGNIQEVIV